MSKDVMNEHLLCAFFDEEMSAKDIDRLLDMLDSDETRSRACRQALAGHAMVSGSGPCVDISAAVRASIAEQGPLTPAQPVFSRRAARLRRPLQRMRQGFVRRRSWQVPAAGVALAASVAMAALVVVKPESALVAPAEPEQLALQSSPASNPSAQARPLQLANATAAPAPLAAAPLRARLPAQLASSGDLGASAGVQAPRELVIASPREARPVQAQWALAQQPGEQLAAQQRVQQQLNTLLINHARHGGGSALPGSLGYARVAAQPRQRKD